MPTHVESQEVSTKTKVKANEEVLRDVQAAISGDERALQRLFYLCDPYIAYAIRKTVKSRGNTDDVDDLVQQTHIRMWSALATYDPHQTRITTWAYNIARNLAVDFLRQPRFTERLLDHNLRDVENTPAGAYSDPFQQTADGEILKELKSYLPERRAEIFFAWSIVGYSLEELAEMFDVSLATVKREIKAAKDVLRTKYEP